jgi:3-oxoacyl-[acyl-carrier protein] reductase
MLLDEKISVVTGAALGIGAGIAELFAEEGALVYVLDIDAEAAGRRAAGIRERGGRAEALACDVAKRETVEYALKTIADRHGRIDILINNAGIYPRKPFLEITEAEWNTMQEVNLKSMFHTCQLTLPYMIARRAGKIVNISSVTFFKGYANLAHYVASKGGVIGLTRALAREMGSHNIHINSVTPGAIKTEGEVVHANPADLERIQQQQCLQRRLLPADVAGACLFLASRLSDGMTGQNLNVDGGLILY